MKKNIKGFTIIELLVVIAIIGLLATISIVALNGARLKGRDAKRVGDMKQLQTALELYYNDNNGYPVQLEADGDATLGSGNFAALCGGATPGFKDDCGADKVYMGAIGSSPTPPTGSAYVYKVNEALLPADNGKTYEIDFSLEGTTGGLGAGAHTVTQAGIK